MKIKETKKHKTQKAIETINSNKLLIKKATKIRK